MLIIDKLAYQSRWRHTDPRGKLVLYGALLGLALAGSPLTQQCQLLGTVALTCYLLRVGLRRYLGWLLIPLLFLLMGLAGILLAVGHSSQGMWWGAQLGPLAVGVDAHGLQVAYHTFWRSMAAMSATYLFVLTTPFNQLIQLLRQCRLPKVLLEHLLLTYRFIFILIEEAAAIHQAQTLRFGYRTPRLGFTSLAMLVGMLLQRVMLRYQQMETTLEVKLFQGEFHL